MPHRFASLSERLTTRNGILLMGAASLAALVYTRGDVRHLVVMYSINVFLTFSLSMLGMLRFWLGSRTSPTWKRRTALFSVGLALCATILAITVVEKFREGGWITLAVTGGVVILCFLVRRHYRSIAAKLADVYRQNVDLARRKLRAGVVLSFLTTAGYYSAYAYVVYRTLMGALSVGTLTFLAGAIDGASANIQMMFSTFSGIADQALFLTDLLAFFAVRPSYPVAPTRFPAPRPIQGGLSFTRVVFLPGNSRPILDRLCHALGARRADRLGRRELARVRPLW